MKDDSHKAPIPLDGRSVSCFVHWGTTVNPPKRDYHRHHHRWDRVNMDTHSGGSTDDPQRQTQQFCQEENIIIILAQDVKTLFLGL